MLRQGTIGLRAVVSAVGFIVLAPTALIVLGGFFPWLPLIGSFGGLIAPNLPGIVVGALIATLLCLAAVRMGGAAFHRALATVAIAVLVGTTLVVDEVLTFASGIGASVDPMRASLPVPATPPGDAPAPDRTVTFPTDDGTELDAEIWMPSSQAQQATASAGPGVVFVHGGGFVGGRLRSRPELFRHLADAGIPVVDVAYRLAPPPRWDAAPGDVLCALTWVGAHGGELGIDTSSIVVVGDSAGGNLALIAAYAPRSMGPTASCASSAPVPAAVIAVAPAADLQGIWIDGTILSDLGRFPEAYVGGPPDAYPNRYLVASPMRLIRPGLPSTLLITGANDRLVRPDRTRALAHLLAASGVGCRILTVPFADHGFDATPNGYGEQLEEWILPVYVQAIARGLDPPLSWPVC